MDSNEPCREDREGSNFVNDSQAPSDSVLLKSLVEDDIYKSLERHFQMQGKGRRPDLPVTPLTHRLLLQLYFLSLGEGHSYRDLKSWLQKLVPNTASVSEARIKHQVRATMTTCSKSTQEEAKLFLSKEFDFHALSEPLSALGLNRLHLTDCEDYTKSPPAHISNAVIVALEHFRSKERMPPIFVRKWINKLSLSVNLSDNQLNIKIQKVLQKYSMLKKNKGKSTQGEKTLTDFMNVPFLDNLVGDAVSAHSTIKCNDCTGLREALAEKEKSLKDLQKENDLCKKTNKDLGEQLELKQHVINDLKYERQKNELLEKDLKARKLEIKELKDERGVLCAKLEKLKSSKLYKQNYVVKKNLSEVTNTCNEMAQNVIRECSKNEVLSKNIDELKAKVKLEQSLKSKLKTQLNEQISLNADFNKMLQHDENKIPCTLKDQGSSHRYQNHVRQTYYALQGEANVSATNCTKVIEIVARHMFNTEFENLPSATTSLNFANEAHIIAKQQVADEILRTNHFTFACDATSRQKAHFLEQHVVLSNGKTLSLGFSEIACDDSQTLLEQCVNIFQDICEIYCLDDESYEKQNLQKDIIRKLQCLMSDRASVMKAFDAKMEKYKRELLEGEDCTVHFLFCNAHFLLGLATAAENGVSSVEEEYVEGGEKLGRDSKSSFARFSAASECAAMRLIRTAAEVLGPRGDEKAGCREEWLAFCSAKEIKSLFSTYRSNRFNNLFQNATALMCHKQDIELFLKEYASSANLKLQSIVADLQDPRVINTIAVLSLFHVYLTDQYWQLMNSSHSYADFPQYVKKMKAFLTEWSSTDFEVTSCQPVFSDFPVSDWKMVLSDFFKSDLFCSSYFLPCLKQIAENMHTVLDRQLSDFLDGGVFGGEIEQNVVAILRTCPLTNLTGEQLFGDFDFDLNKRRNASLHIRSTTNMWKHNRTARWLRKQDSSVARKLLKKAIRYGPEWKKRSSDQNKAVKEKIKARIFENKRKKDEKEVKNKERKLKALDAVLTEGATVVTNKEELDTLYHGANALEKLKDQIRYRSLVRGEKITLKGNKKMLYERLLRHITDN